MMQIIWRRKTIFIVTLCFVIYIIYLIFASTKRIKSESPQSGDDIREQELLTKYRNWVDYELSKRDKDRVGLGEQGADVTLTNQEEIDRNDKLFQETGFSVLVSNKISVNRSLADVVHPDCMKVLYYSRLPNVSVIIIFHNEVKSVLLRTVHSVINRTPPELLHEIILVNDNSTDKELYEPLKNYVKNNFHSKVKIKNLTKRSGLIVTRMEGARMATGEVLVFFDSHIEVQLNWLPPLLQPIADNRRIATLPIIDYFDPFTFGYVKDQESFQGDCLN